MAFGINRMDLLQREGFYPPPAGSSDILGVEFSGYISEIGAGVSGWQINDEVLGLVGGVSILLKVVFELLNSNSLGCLCGIYRCAGYSHHPQAWSFNLGRSCKHS
jgi:NADPH:quinone reductase-like Zn-dependent oxidoreductase